MEYKDYIRGKNVIFVGASPIMVGRGEGVAIDKNDVVVRTNGSINLIDDLKFRKDYGKKIDVLYTNNQFYREMRPFPVDAWRRRGVKFLRMKTCKNDDMRSMQRINPAIIKNALRDIDSRFKGAVMGAYIVSDLLSCKPKKLTITGVDFFSSKNKVFVVDDYREYFPGYLPDKIRKQGNIINVGKVEDGHNLVETNKFLLDLLAKGYICMPKYVSDLLAGLVHD